MTIQGLSKTKQWQSPYCVSRAVRGAETHTAHDEHSVATRFSSHTPLLVDSFCHLHSNFLSTCYLQGVVLYGGRRGRHVVLVLQVMQWLSLSIIVSEIATNILFLKPFKNAILPSMVVHA